MKRYEDLEDTKNQHGEKLPKNKPQYPSRCLSISLREMEQADKKAASLAKNSEHSSDQD